MKRISTTALLLVVMGCGDGDGKASLGPQEQAIYRLDSYTDNPTTCDAEGASALKDTADHLVLFHSKDLFGEALNARVCADPAGCRSDVATRLGGGGLITTFDIQLREKHGEDLTGVLITSGFSMGGTCKNAEVTRVTLKRPAEGRVSLEARTVIVDHPPDSEGICWTDATVKAAEGKPCGRLRVITGTRIETL